MGPTFAGSKMHHDDREMSALGPVADRPVSIPIPLDTPPATQIGRLFHLSSSCRVNSGFMRPTSSATTTRSSNPEPRSLSPPAQLEPHAERYAASGLRLVWSRKQMLCMFAANSGAEPYRLRQPPFPSPALCQHCLRVRHPRHLIRPQPPLRAFDRTDVQHDEDRLRRDLTGHVVSIRRPSGKIP